MNAPALHQALVEHLKREGHLRSPSIEAAFRTVPRHLFLPQISLNAAYQDEAIPTKQVEGKAVSSSSQPAIMAIMLEQLGLAPGQRVLEIGAGTGYNAALMAHIVGPTGQIIALDIDEDIVQAAREHLAAAGYSNVQVMCADGGMGWPEAAPYDRIILTVGARDILPAWRAQLKPDGRLVLPLSLPGTQQSAAFLPAPDHLVSVSLVDCGFMMLRGEWAEADPVLPLGPEPGLSLTHPTPTTLDGKALFTFLTGPAQDWPTGLHTTPPELWGGLLPWLGRHAPDRCTLTVERPLAYLPTPPCLMGQPDRGCLAPGLLSENGLGFLVYPNEWRWGTPIELRVRQFGPDPAPAQRLLNHVRAWEAAGRPTTARSRIRAYPIGMAIELPPEAFVVSRRWTRFVLDERPPAV